jgi:hypothetical protein
MGRVGGVNGVYTRVITSISGADRLTGPASGAFSAGLFDFPPFSSIFSIFMQRF